MDRMLKGAFLALALAGAVLTGCGGGGSGGGTGEKAQGVGAPQEGKPGGKLTVLWTDDVDNIDCGISYYQMGYMVCYATQRPLYSWKPEDGTTPGARPRDRRPAGLRGRQDRHREDPQRRQVLARRSIAR